MERGVCRPSCANVTSALARSSSRSSYVLETGHTVTSVYCLEKITQAANTAAAAKRSATKHNVILTCGSFFFHQQPRVRKWFRYEANVYDRRFVSTQRL